ncbi:PIG-L deacetylase family protein [Saccharothrix stipae]
MDVLMVFSPHLDDAVLSVGASLAAVVQSGGRVVVCTVFAGDPPEPLSPAGRAFHRHCGLGDDGVATRRAEDRDAAAVLGVEVVHLPVPDCLYRRGPAGWLYDRPGASLDPGWPPEPGVVAEVARHVRRLLRVIRPAAVWTCLALGGHVDHRLCRTAVETACAGEGLTPHLWEDLPYALGTPAPAGPVTARPVRGTHLATKLAAVERYRSQVRVLWPDGADWRADLLTHHAGRRAAAGGAEPLRQPAASTPSGTRS